MTRAPAARATNGPAAKPLELKRAQGNPGHQKLPDKTTTIALEPAKVVPPRDLGKRGRAMWRHVTAQKWVAVSDTAALFELCEVADLAQRLKDDIEATGVKYEARGRWLRNPSVDAYFEAQKRLTTLLSLFGLTPADRTRLGIAEIKAKSKFEELMEQRNGGPRGG